MRGLYIVIKNDVMNANWFIKILQAFITFLKQNDSKIILGARIQYLDNGCLSSSFFFCDDETQNIDAANRGYVIKPLAEFTDELIREQWKIADRHWEIEFYAFIDGCIEPISTLAFRSYAPAVVLRNEPGTIISDTKSIAFVNNLDDIQSSTSGNDAASQHIDLAIKGTRLPLSDPRFDCLRR
ncbi:MAG TPA: hypothetical protein DIC35_02950 [Candidatus Moranbacteria bacterium]|nr:hypothetical protein [Candidatus Moranbacteria bacterium]